MMDKQNMGFTLLEVLIALLVLSIGLLGLAGLQTRGLATGHNAYLRSQAVLLTDDMAERIRANKIYALSTGNAYTQQVSSPQTCFDDSCTCVKAACTGNDMAIFDVEQWAASLANILPQGQGTITRNGSIYTITTQWNISDSRNTNNPEKSYFIDVDLGT